VLWQLGLLGRIAARVDENIRSGFCFASGLITMQFT
jgi:hypothetical protein